MSFPLSAPVRGFLFWGVCIWRVAATTHFSVQRRRSSGTGGFPAKRTDHTTNQAAKDWLPPGLVPALHWPGAVGALEYNQFWEPPTICFHRSSSRSDLGFVDDPDEMPKSSTKISGLTALRLN